MKRLYADDSADSRVKVGNRQAPLSQKPPPERRGFLHFGDGNACAALGIASRAECADGRDVADRVGEVFGEMLSGVVRAADAEVMTEGCVPLL